MRPRFRFGGRRSESRRFLRSRIGGMGVPRADSTYAGGRRGKERAARYERSSDWRRGAQRPRPVCVSCGNVSCLYSVLDDDVWVNSPAGVKDVVGDAAFGRDVDAGLEDGCPWTALLQIVLGLLPELGAVSGVGLDVDLVAQ